MRRRCVSAAIMLTLMACTSEPIPAFHPAAGRDLCQGTAGFSAAFEGRRTFLWRADWLKHRKAELGDTDPVLVTLRADADMALARGPYTVVEKTTMPPSGDKRDYYSQATYWWPDPNKSDGLPYIRKDGETNPDVYSGKFDLDRLERMSGDVTTLGLAYYFTDDDRYARHAAALLQTWFLDQATAMKPHLAFAQGIPGRNEGRPTGIIETKNLVPVVEAIGLLQKSGALSPEDLRGLQSWFADYVAWLRNSEAGQEEGGSTNNHALAYDVQLISFALFSNQAEIAREIVADFAGQRIVPQFASDGSLPEELARTRTFHYSLLALDITMDVATLGECVGLDLWRFQEADRSALRAAVDFLVPYVGREDSWPYAETDDASAWHEYKIHFRDLLTQAAWAYEVPLYAALAGKYDAGPSGTPMHLIMPKFEK